MKRIALWFITLQLLDLALTAYALEHGLAREINPLGFDDRVIVLKFSAAVAVFLVVQFVKLPRLAWVVVWISYAVAVWNAVNVAVELLV
jgi:hypothetical protein